MSSGQVPELGPDGVPVDWPDCPKCGAMRFYPSGRCMQYCDKRTPSQFTTSKIHNLRLAIEAAEAVLRVLRRTLAEEEGKA